VKLIEITLPSFTKISSELLDGQRFRPARLP
jgi:hypothetical protein